MGATPTTTPRYVLMKNNYRRRLELHTLEVLQTPSVGEVCVYPEVSSFPQFISCLGIGVCPRILLYKKMKKMGGVAMVTILSPSTRCHGKYSQCPTFDIKQSPTRRSPEDHQVRTHAYLYLNKAQSCPLPPFICSRML